MKRLSFISASALVVGLVAGLSARPAQASESDRLTYFTFSAPVEVLGVGLPAGTYIFKLADSGSGSNVVQVFSRDGKTLYSSFFAVADTTLEPAADPTVTFYEAAAGAPQAIRTGFTRATERASSFSIPSSRPPRSQARRYPG